MDLYPTFRTNWSLHRQYVDNILKSLGNINSVSGLTTEF
jgi:hypothetical protein